MRLLQTVTLLSVLIWSSFCLRTQTKISVERRAWIVFWLYFWWHVLKTCGQTFHPGPRPMTQRWRNVCVLFVPSQCKNVKHGNWNTQPGNCAQSELGSTLFKLDFLVLVSVKFFYCVALVLNSKERNDPTSSSFYRLRVSPLAGWQPRVKEKTCWFLDSEEYVTRLDVLPVMTEYQSIFWN